MELALIDFGLARFIDGREYVPQIDYFENLIEDIFNNE